MKLKFHNHHKSKNILFITGAVFALLVLGLTIYIQKQQTSTRSDAAANTQTLEGEYIQMHMDNIEEGKSLDQAVLRQDNGESKILKFSDGKIDPGIVSGSRVKIKGKVYSGNIIELVAKNQKPIQVLRSPPKRETLPKQAPAGSNVKGISAKTLKVAVVLIKFPDLNQEPYSKEDVRSAVFTAGNSVNKWANENSYGKVSVGGVKNAEGDVFGYYTMSKSKNSYGGGCAADAAYEATEKMKNEGVNPASYDFIIYTYPRPGDCYWGGMSTGGKILITLRPEKATAEVWRRYAIHESAHEIGVHNHGKGLVCNTSGVIAAIAQTCTSTDGYSDPYDFVGGGRHYNGAHKEQVGFIDSSQIKTVTSSGTYQVEPLATPGSGVKVLRIKAGSSQLSGLFTFGTSGNTPYLYIDFRRPFGFDTFPNMQHINGVFIRRVEVKTNGISDTYRDTHLVDNTPNNQQNYNDAVLPVGQVFYDSANKISIEATGVNNTSASVKVTLNSQGGSSPTPTNASVPTATKQPTPTTSSPTTAIPTPTKTSAPTPNQAASGDAAPPSIPGQLMGYGIQKGSYLMWRASSDNVGVAGYHITRNNVRIKTLPWPTGNYQNVYYTDGGLVTNARYIYKVQAYDAKGNVSGFSNAVTVVVR